MLEFWTDMKATHSVELWYFSNKGLVYEAEIPVSHFGFQVLLLWQYYDCCNCIEVGIILLAKCESESVVLTAVEEICEIAISSVQSLSSV